MFSVLLVKMVLKVNNYLYFKFEDGKEIATSNTFIEDVSEKKIIREIQDAHKTF